VSAWFLRVLHAMPASLWVYDPKVEGYATETRRTLNAKIRRTRRQTQLSWLPGGGSSEKHSEKTNTLWKGSVGESVGNTDERLNGKTFVCFFGICFHCSQGSATTALSQTFLRVLCGSVVLSLASVESDSATSKFDSLHI